MTRLKSIGYWHSNYEPYLPKVTEFIDLAWDFNEWKIVIKYLDCGKIHESWMGSSDCRLCGISNGSKCLTDDVYVWPEGYVHYVKKHYVKPPTDFIEHVMNIANKILQNKK